MCWVVIIWASHLQPKCAAKVCSQSFRVIASETHWYRLIELITKFTTDTCHWKVRLMLFRTASNSTRLMYWASFAGCNQHASSISELVISNVTSVTKEPILIQTLISWTFTHQLPCNGSLLHIFIMVSSKMVLTWGSSVMSSHHIHFMFDECHGHVKPTTQRKMSHKLSTHSEDILSCDNIRDLWNSTSTLQSKLTMLLQDLQIQHLCTILELLWILTY